MGPAEGKAVEAQPRGGRGTARIPEGGGEGFAEWEAAVRLYAAMSLVNGWLERQGPGVPTGHRTRRRMAERCLPHLFNGYGRICALSEDAGTGRAIRGRPRAPEGARDPRAHLNSRPAALARPCGRRPAPAGTPRRQRQRQRRPRPRRPARARRCGLFRALRESKPGIPACRALRQAVTTGGLAGRRPRGGSARC